MTLELRASPRWGGSERPQSLGRLLKVNPARATLVLATVCITILELVLPVTILQVYDRVVPNRSVETLQVLFTVAALLLITDAALRVARADLIVRTGAEFSHRVGRKAVETFLGNRHVAPTGTAEGVALLASVRGLKEGHNGQSLVTLVEIVLTPIAIGLVALIAGPLAIVPLIVLIAFATLAYRNGKAISEATDARKESDEKRYEFIIGSLRAIHSIKSQAMENRVLRRYEGLKHDSCLANLGVSRELTGAFDLSATFGTAMTFAIVMGGAAMVLSGWITVGAMIASVILSGRIVQPVQKAMSFYLRKRNMQNEELDAQELLTLEAEDMDGTNPAPRNVGEVELRAACWVGTGPGATLRLAPYETYVLDGMRADRTAFFHLLTGLVAPRTGEVLLNGRPAVSISEDQRARQVAWLRQDGTIYRGTLMDNLSRFGQCSSADVLYVARLLKLEDDISSLPSGLETSVSGLGSDPIPPGLKQRVYLARQLAPRPHLILFDHADTGLDRRSYTAVYELFARLRGKATIVLATADHNLAALATRRLSITPNTIEDSSVAAHERISLATYCEVRI